jgi:hypothetical protein
VATMALFRLVGEVRTAARSEVLPVLHELLPGGEVRETDTGFEVEAQLEGENAQELNRTLLSTLRRIERRTTLRAEWSSGLTIERYFDYVRKSTQPTR